MEPRPDHQFDPFSDEARQYDDLDLGNIDHSDPLAFFKAIGAGGVGGLPMPKLMSPKEVRKQARAFSASIFTDFDALSSILDRHESTIQKRWKKKTQEQRRKVLLSAWKGQMSKQHRPDFEAFRKETEAQRESGTQYREAFIWPYINQEDLIKSKILPLFLNSRGRNLPATFAAADFEAMHMGLITKAISPVFLNEHVFLCRSGTSPETYGRLLNWDEHPDAFDWMHTRKEHLPGEGLLILEAQARVMSFLLKCVKEILPDITEQELLHGPLQSIPLQMTEDGDGLASLAVMTAESPYRVPHQLSFERIESLLAAKRDEAADHLWSLREDPGYFNLWMRDASEHRQEIIKDKNGQTHPLFRRHREDILWGRVLKNEITSSYLLFETWSELLSQCVKLKAMQTRYQAKIEARDDLPEDYLKALLTFQHWAKQAAKGPIGQLKIAVVASPPWRPYFEREPISNPTTTAISTQQKSGVKMSKSQEQLFWLLRTLWEDGKPLFLAGITNVVDELQRLIEASKEASDMLTSYTASIVADLSVIAQCLHQLALYQPWANTFESALVDKKQKIMEDFAHRTKSWALILEATGGDAERVLATHGSPKEIDFRYPIGKRRSRDNVAVMQQAEANLDKFWSTVDDLMHRRGGDMQGTVVRSLLAERKLRRTPEWIEPSKEQVNKGVADVSEIVRPLSELYFDLEQRTERTTSKQKVSINLKTKNKTRGESSSGTTSVAEQPSLGDSTRDLQPTFQVDARALKVFKTLFFNPSLTATPGEVSWTDFLHAMISTGFRAEKLYGSIWQFNPTRLDVERGIQFHEPHPTDKIPYLIARRHGRRLNRAYGWHGGMFELAKKV